LKGKLKTIRSILLCGLALAASFYFVHAQTVSDTTGPVMTDPNEDVSNLSDLAVEIKALELATPIAASNEPSVGNFYSAQHAPGSASEWPPLPGNIDSLPVWPLDINTYLLDDLHYNYAKNLVKTSQTANGVEAEDDFEVPSPPGGGSDTNTYNPPILTDLMPNYGTNLFVASLGMLSGNLTGIASNTIAVEYAIQTNSDLTTTNWADDGQFILGSAVTNWTQFTLPPPLLTNNLFFRLQSEASADNSGIASWYETEYFGTNTVNVNALDSAGDGWTIYQKYVLGDSPATFVTPPAPQDLSASYDANTDDGMISWLPSPGPVTGYTLEKTYTIPFVSTQVQDFSLSATATNYTDSLSGEIVDPYNYDITYRLQANYAGGGSAWTAAVPLEITNITAAIVAGTNGTAFLAVSEIPANTASLLITIGDEYSTSFDMAGDFDYTTNIPVSAFSNGLYQLPSSLQETATNFDGVGLYDATIQAVATNGNTAAVFASANDWDAPFYDGRVQMKQNLIFQLRAATIEAPFQFLIPFYTSPPANFGYFAGPYSYPTNYAYAGLFQFANPAAGNNYGTVDPFMPFEENYLFRNFVFTPGDVNASGDLNAVSGGYDYEYLPGFPGPYHVAVNNVPPAYYIQTNALPFPALLATNTTRWLFYDQAEYVIGSDGFVNADWNQLTLSMTNDLVNWFGLPYLAEDVVYPGYDANGNSLGLTTSTIESGGTLDLSYGSFYNVDPSYADVYPETAQPQFQLVDYYFANADSVWNQASNAYVGPFVPGSPAFSPTNQSQVLITEVGASKFQITGYAKLAVTNSVYTGVDGYLGQYFEQAYQIGTNGVVTTNTTGVLSPYGNFFATQAGAAAVVTMPDPDTDLQGTGIVYAVSLNVDKNHDGTMDLSWNGPDTTLQNSPFVFWANNNYDRWKYDEADATNYMDDVQEADCPYTPNTATPDCNYRDIDGNRVIPDTRDLEDYARLWVCGIDSNLLANLPAGSTVTLNWGDVGNPNTNNPTIDLFQAEESDGGIGYLTNETVATEQINPVYSAYVGRVEPGQSVQLNSSFFSGWAGNHFIWCGVSNGTGGLNLTIMDANSNVLAQTTAYIQIKDIKQIYERWTLGDDLSAAPSTNAIPATDNGFPLGSPGFQYPLPQDTNTPYILFVHGWNMESWEKDRFAETAYKRLYWQGYQGRFGLLRWPTGNDFTGDMSQLLADPTEKDNYDSSEYNASLSGVGLLNKLISLNAEYPGHVYVLAHSMGNVVTGEALHLAGDNQVVNTYVASQAALSAHLYDATVPDYSFTRSVPLGPIMINYSFGPVTPDIYVNWFADNNGDGAGQVISFYNTNDYALSFDHWQLDEVDKPDVLVVENGSTWNYGYNGSANDPAPWNNFFKTNDYTGATINFDIVNTVSNRYEVMAYAAQSYTTALGATPSVHNVAKNVDLTDQANGIWPLDPTGNNYIEHFWHSAEFRDDNAMMQGYWNYLLGAQTFGLK
jgi:hypothetical protein